MPEPEHNIRYVAVARVSDKTVVADTLTSESGELTKGLVDGKMARVLASERVRQGGRLTIVDKDVGNINYDADPACLYLVITSTEFPQRSAFKFLEDVRTDFEKELGDELNSAKEFGLNKKARPLFKNIITKFESAAASTKLQTVTLQVDEVKGAMQNNINAVLKNQENLETLLESSSTMRTEASAFQRSAAKAKDRLWWQNMRLLIAIIVLLIVLVLIIVIPMVTKVPAVPLSAP